MSQRAIRYKHLHCKKTLTVLLQKNLIVNLSTPRCLFILCLSLLKPVKFCANCACIYVIVSKHKQTLFIFMKIAKTLP
jgi:hypothetical protein